MGISTEQYDATPALTVDWDMQFTIVENRAQQAINDRASS